MISVDTPIDFDDELAEVSSKNESHYHPTKRNSSIILSRMDTSKDSKKETNANVNANSNKNSNQNYAIKFHAELNLMDLLEDSMVVEQSINSFSFATNDEE